MEHSKTQTGLGILLVALGGLFLLQNFGYLGEVGNLIWTVLFGVGGLAFLWVFLANREQWWALIPGFTLLGLAGTLFLGALNIAGGWVGAFLLGAIGMAFLVIYLIRREYWWAIIPAGALFSVALASGVSTHLPSEASGGILFLGLAATFGVLYLIPTPMGRLSWALIPAAILAVIGLLVLISAGNLMGLVLPVALMVGGAFVVLRTLARRS